MAKHWQLKGYSLEHFSGTHDLADLLKEVRKFVKSLGDNVIVDDLSVNYDGEIGWSATVQYLGGVL